MIDEFKKPYTKEDDISSQSHVFCMRCNVEIMGPSYVEMPKRNSNKESVNVWSRKKYSNYSLAEVVIEKNGVLSKTYLPLCKDCKDFKLTDGNAPLIAEQIIDATKRDALWNGYPESYVNGINTLKILRRN